MTCAILTSIEGWSRTFSVAMRNAGVNVSSEQAIRFFPGEVFGGAYARGQEFQINAHQEFQKLGKAEAGLLAAYWKLRSAVLLDDRELTSQFGTIMK